MSAPAAFQHRLVAGAIAVLFAGSMVTAAPTAQSKKLKDGPEVFNARASATTESGRGDVYVTIRVDRYTPEKNIAVMEKALKEGGTESFLTELRRAPVAGRLEIGTRSFGIRWARQRATDKGRAITFAVDSPVYFVGGGVPGAKDRTGFNVAVVQITIDDAGVGEGTMAPAAKVKPGGPTGVEVESYSESPVKLHSVMKLIS